MELTTLSDTLFKDVSHGAGGNDVLLHFAREMGLDRPIALHLRSPSREQWHALICEEGFFNSQGLAALLQATDSLDLLKERAVRFVPYIAPRTIVGGFNPPLEVHRQQGTSEFRAYRMPPARLVIALLYYYWKYHGEKILRDFRMRVQVRQGKDEALVLGPWRESGMHVYVERNYGVQRWVVDGQVEVFSTIDRDFPYDILCPIEMIASVPFGLFLIESECEIG